MPLFLCPQLGEKMPARKEVFARILFLCRNSRNSRNKIDL